MTAATLAAKVAAKPHCTIAWCDHKHAAPKPGSEILWHGRVFAEKDFPGGRRVVIAAGWGEPLTSMRDTGNIWVPNRAKPPYIQIAHVDRDGDHSTIEVEVFEAMVLADCMRVSGDGWLGETLAAIADEVYDGTPEGYDR